MNCESCGMPMEKQEDHGGGDSNNTWCLHCCHEDGSHKSREEVREGMIQWMMGDECENAGFPKAKSREEAEKRADGIMAMMPAWKSTG